MQVICINDTFPEEYRRFYELHRVVTPYIDCVYTVRDVINSRWGIGLHLEELRNPLVPLYGEGEDAMKAEPNWGIFRFRNIDGTDVNIEQLKDELKKQNTGITT